MKLKLYGASLSPFVRKTAVVLDEKGLDFEQEHTDPNRLPEDYHKLNPLLRIPALEADGKPLADSAVICHFLELTHPEPALLPADPYDRARALWFEKYADYELAPLTTFCVFRNRVLMKLLGQPQDESRINHALEKLPAYFDYLEEQLGDNDFFVGNQLSIADIAIATQFVNFEHGGEKPDATRWPKLAAFIEKMHARESFAKLIEREKGFLRKIFGGE